MAQFNTKLLSAQNKDNISLCAELIKKGEVIGIPTETVYGLAGNALNTSAIEKIFLAKGRPQDNPLIVHICELSMLDDLVYDIPPLALKLAEKFWPGPLTMIMKKKDIIPFSTSGGLDTVGIRMPSHPVALELIKECGLPLAAPSANLSGLPSPTTAQHVFKDLNGKIPAILDGGACSVGVESTVICFENDGVRILRPGLISAEDFSQICTVHIDKGVVEKVDSNEKVRSPGMKYKHYSPKADIVIIEGDLDGYINFMDTHYSEGTYCVVFDEDEKYIKYPCMTYGNTSRENARELFDVLRELDDRGAERAYFRCPDKKGAGLAVYNRLLRSAGFEVIKV